MDDRDFRVGLWIQRTEGIEAYRAWFAAHAVDVEPADYDEAAGMALVEYFGGMEDGNSIDLSGQ